MEKQLDERESDGLRVELLYDDDCKEVIIVVNDKMYGDLFTLRPPLDRIREYFDHPFAFRGLATQVTTPTGGISERIHPYTHSY